ncbi:MAG: helix-turn-helix transcriptional regulator [Bacillota bacterium]|nr:helix-turn-helix transcriptional regulator [Bacillota bacterium]
MKAEYKDKYKMLGLNIAYYRKLRGYTQESLAEKIGIDQTHMSKIEIASVGISLDVYFSICKALDVEPSKLMEFREKN